MADTLLTLYGMGQSRSFRCLWALEESGLDYDYVRVNTRTPASEPGSTRTPDYLALNIQGKVPTLVNGDLVPEREFAVAGQFTLVDILLAQTFNWAIHFEFDVPRKYIELRDRHYERPAARRALRVIG